MAVSLPLLVAGAVLFPGVGWAVVLGLVFDWVGRRVAAGLQSRVGPLHGGPGGSAVPLFDLLKLLGKEDVWPLVGDSSLSSAALVWGVALAGFPSLLLPWLGRGVVGFRGDVLVLLACLGLSHGLLFLGAAASRSPYPLIGGLRLLGLLAAGDLVVVSSVAAVLLVGGCPGVSAGCGAAWIGAGVLGLVVWVLAAVAGFLGLWALVGLSPFSLPEAETEIAGGVYAEFSGRRLAYARLVDLLHRVVLSCLYASAVLGLPLHGGLAGVVELFLGGLLVYVAAVVVSQAAPRMRPREALAFLWGRLVPLSLFAASLAALAGLLPR